MSSQRRNVMHLLPALALAMVMCVPVRDAVASQAFRVYLFDDSSCGFERVDDPLAVWQWGEPVGSTVIESVGNVWATELDSHYLPNMTSVLRSPSFSLTDHPGASLVLYHYYDIDPNGTCTLSDGTDMGGICGDGGFVQLVDGTGTPHVLTPMGGYDAQVVYADKITGAFSGQSGAWIASYFDLEAYTDDNLAVELVFVSNDSRWADGWYLSSLSFYDGDIIPPSVSIKVRPGDTSDVVGPYPVVATASDNRDVVRVTLYYRLDGGEAHAIDMARNALGFWEADIPGQAIGTEVAYYVEAVDASDNTATAPNSAPNGAWASFRVRLPAPTSLEFVPSPPPTLAPNLQLQWSPPKDIGDQGFSQYGQSIVDYQVVHTVLDSGGTVAEQGVVADQDGDNTDLGAIVEAAGRPYVDQYQVRARYQVEDRDGVSSLVLGDLSGPVSTMVYVPYIQSVVPSSEYRGESTRVQVVGAYTSFVEGDVWLDFGRGITVTDLSVVSVTRINATITLADDVPLGDRPVVVHTGDYDLTSESGFEVVDQATRPRIVDVEPDHIRVREEKTIKFTGANTDFIHESPSVDFWDDIRVKSLEVVSDTEFVVDIEVTADASVGERTVRVISGSDMFDVTFWVESGEPVTTTACSTSANGDSMTSDFALMIAMFGSVLLLKRHLRATGKRRRGDHEIFRCVRAYFRKRSCCGGLRVRTIGPRLRPHTHRSRHVSI